MVNKNQNPPQTVNKRLTTYQNKEIKKSLKSNKNNIFLLLPTPSPLTS